MSLYFIVYSLRENVIVVILLAGKDDVKAGTQKLVTADGTYATQSAFTSNTAKTIGSGEDKRY